MLTKVRFGKRPQLFLRVQHHHLKRVEVQQPSDDGRPVTRDDTVEAVFRKDFGVGIEQRRFELLRTCEVDPMSVRSGPRRDPFPKMRWQLWQLPLPATIAAPAVSFPAGSGSVLDCPDTVATIECGEEQWSRQIRTTPQK